MPPRNLPTPPWAKPGYGEDITPGPVRDSAADPMAQAKAFADWARETLPGYCAARAWRLGGGPARVPTRPEQAVRVYITWGLDPRWNQHQYGHKAASFVHFNPGPLEFVHRDPPPDMRLPMSPANPESVAAIRDWVARNGGES